MKSPILFTGLLLLGIVSVGYAEDKPPEFYNVESEVALKNLHMDCMRTWAMEGESQRCDVETVNKDMPNFQAPPGVEITVTDGTSDGFNAQATHPEATKIVTINTQGDIKSELK